MRQIFDWAGFRDQWPLSPSVSVTSQSNLPSLQIGGSRSANQDILRALRQHVALGSPSVQTMPPSPLPVSPGASIPSRTESLTSRVIRVLRLGRLWHSELARASALAVASITGLLIVISVIPHRRVILSRRGRPLRPIPSRLPLGLPKLLLQGDRRSPANRCPLTWLVRLMACGMQQQFQWAVKW